MRFAQRRWVGGPEARLLPQDASTLAVLYDADPQAHWLHGFALAYQDVDGFMAHAALHGDAWLHTSAGRGFGVVGEPLRDLFRIALWAEVRAGFATYFSEALAIQYADLGPRLQDALLRAAQTVPELEAVDVVPCLPLQTHGRLLHPRGARPIIYAGVPTLHQDDPLPHAVIQAAHEAVLATLNAAVPTSPAADDPRFAGHWMVEVATLARLSRRVLGTRLAPPHADWLTRIRAAEFIGSRLPEVPTSSGALQAWLAGAPGLSGSVLSLPGSVLSLLDEVP